jgi:hypothetical protein
VGLFTYWNLNSKKSQKYGLKIRGGGRPPCIVGRFFQRRREIIISFLHVCVQKPPRFLPSLENTLKGERENDKERAIS